MKVWEASVQSQVRFNRAPEKTEGLGGSLRCRARSGSTAFQRRFRRRCGRLQVTFNRVPDGEGSREGERLIWCKAMSSSTGFREGSREGRGGFGAEPGQVQQGSDEEGSGEGSGRL